MIRPIRQLVPFLFLAITGCATVDFDYPKSASWAVTATDDTRLGRRIAPVVAPRGGDSGFVLQVDGIESLAARMHLAGRAERTIDAQYYLIRADRTGYLFIGALLRAADRGVRVRLLIDDIVTKGYDAGMAALDAHPHFEVRVFNPFAARRRRLADALRDFRRVNRRMHNKSFTVDNQVTVVGGRNIADEYFAASDEVNMADLDALCVGPVVHEVSRRFDLYWNHRAAAAVPAFAEIPEDPVHELARLRQRIEAARRAVEGTPYADVLKTDVESWAAVEESRFTWASATVVSDSPDKVYAGRAARVDSIVPPLREAIDEARSELIVISPYFVLRSKGIEFMRRLRARGVTVRVITNSLASNNHPIVHSGYTPARRALLESGVEIHEFMPDVSVRGAARAGMESAGGVLHTKAFVVDRQRLFLGSFNFDPRSALINTELGMIIDSPRLANHVGALLDRHLDRATYRVEMDDRGRLRWIDRAVDPVVTHTVEPETTALQRFWIGLLRLLPIKGQL